MTNVCEKFNLKLRYLGNEINSELVCSFVVNDKQELWLTLEENELTR